MSFIEILDKLVDSCEEYCKQNGINIDRKKILYSFDLSGAHADVAIRLPFILAKLMERPPQDIAMDLAEHIEYNNSVEGGYVNVFLNVEDLDLEIEFPELNKRVIIEHTSINPVKPLHAGHLRNALLGDVLGRMFQALKCDVEIQNYIDDLGRQVATLLWGLQSATNPTEDKYDLWLGKQYAKFAEEAPDEEIEQVMHELEKGHELKQKVTEECVKANLETTWKLNVFYDLLSWENDIVNAGLFERAMNLLWENKGVEKVESGDKKGCVVLKGTDKVLIRSNGIPVYVAKDIAYQLWKWNLIKGMKFRKFIVQPNGRELYSTGGSTELNRPKPDIVVNVIAMEQEYTQNIVREALKILGYEKEFENSHHLSYGWVWLPGQKKFSGRKGNWIGYHVDAIYNHVFKNALNEVKTRWPELQENEAKERARKITVAAIRFGMLKVDHSKQFVFEWDKVSDFQGETGPYIQYTYARAMSVLKKAGEFKKEEPKEDALKLLIHMNKAPYVLKEATLSMEPYKFVQYVYDLAKKFSEFYETTQILNSENRNAHLTVVKAYTQLMKKCASILGIELMDQM